MRERRGKLKEKREQLKVLLSPSDAQTKPNSQAQRRVRRGKKWPGNRKAVRMSRKSGNRRHSESFLAGGRKIKPTRAYSKPQELESEHY